jgi:hypothetical protein
MKITLLALLTITVVMIMGCSQKQGTSTPASTGQGAGTMTPVPADIKAREFVTFDFTDVAVSTSGSPVLRLTFNAKNGSNDPLLCDESSFSLELQDGTVLPPDAGAQNVCDPDSIDPSGTSNVVMFFDVPSGYSGPVMLLMRTSDNTLVGQGTTTLH